MDAIGWAAVLPQMLAALGRGVRAAGVGDDRRRACRRGHPRRQRVPRGAASIALGMALFTMIMGNAFAAFPVMAAAIGVPLLIQRLRRRSGGGRRGRDAGGLLRHADDADGGQLQPRPRRAARAQGPARRDQGADRRPRCRCSSSTSLIIYVRGVPRDARPPTSPRVSARIALGPCRARISAQARSCAATATTTRATPRALHPIFYGSFDWHSCVHGWWTLLTLRRLFPDMRRGGRDRALADAMLHRRTRSRASSPISTGR